MLLVAMHMTMLGNSPVTKYPKSRGVYADYTISGPTVVGINTVLRYTIPSSMPVGSYWSVSAQGVLVNYTLTEVIVKWNILGTGTTGSLQLLNAAGQPLASLTVTGGGTWGTAPSPAAQVANYNSTPAAISVSNLFPCSSPSYQWQYSYDQATWLDVAVNGNAASYQPPAATVTTFYRRRQTCLALGKPTTTTSAPAVVVVTNAPLQGGSITPASQNLGMGAPVSQLSLTGVSGGNFIYSFQWQSREEGSSTWTNVSGTDVMYDPGALLITTHFRVAVTSNGTTAYSNEAVVNITPAVITPASQDVGAGAPVSQLTLNASGGNAYNFQWQSRPDGSSTWTNVSGTDVTYTPGFLFTTTHFRVVITANGSTTYSSEAVVNISPALQPGSISPAAVTTSYNTSPGIITASPATGGNCPTYTYEWQQSSDNVNFSSISNTNTLYYSAPAVTSTTYFRRKVSCGSLIAYTNPSVVTVATLTNANVNYIRVREFSKPITDAGLAESLVRPGSVKQTTQYFDGLGRLQQTVGRQVSPTQTDMVIPNAYDDMGREAVKYMPYIASTGDGFYKPAALNDQKSFNTTQFNGEQFYYNQSVFETSPLSRQKNEYDQGANWVGSGRGLTRKYQFNTVTDLVKKWVVNDVKDDWGTYSNSNYDVGQLHKSITTDEGNKQTIEFIDGEGRLILKKVQFTAAPDDGSGSDYTGWLCTYYVYDVRNNLRLVIQPAGVELLIQNSWDLNALGGDILNEQCFRYEYDQRTRKIREKTPGAGETWMVYDVLNRLVMTQDANQRAVPGGKWTVNMYDDLDRVVETGVWDNSGDLTTHAALANAAAHYPFTFGGTPVSGYQMLTRNGYDDYNSLPAASGLNGSLDNTYTGSNYMNTSYNTAPAFAQPVTQAANVKGLMTWTVTNVLNNTNNTYVYRVNIYDDHTRIIQEKSTNITSGTDVITTQYSFTGQPLVSVSKQEKGGAVNAQVHIVITSMDYDVAGHVQTVYKEINSTVNGVTVTQPKEAVVQNTYNTLGQLQSRQLGHKKDPSGNVIGVLETLNFDYNVRGWLLGINRAYTADNATGSSFGFELGYDKINNTANRNFTSPQYNGNVTGIVWKSIGDGIQRKYDYTYDEANRLLKADFEQHNTDLSWNNAQVNYNVTMGDGNTSASAYDANGNIKRMQQWGLVVTGSTPIDDLIYGYYPNSNKLATVADQSGGGTQPTSSGGSALGDFTDRNATGNDYGYDLNGNMVSDLNKTLKGSTGLNVTSGGAVSYNYLNLPQQVNITDNNVNKGNIQYVYDADGNKLQKIATDLSVAGKTITTTTTYLSGAVYESKTTVPHTSTDPADYTDKLLFISSEEGRSRFTPGDPISGVAARFDNDYFLKDHLGNVRMVLTDEQGTSIYQAGMEDANRNFEMALFGNKVNTTAVDKPGGFDSDAANAKVSAVNGTTADGRVGPGVIMKVMAGDKFTARTYAWYQPTGMDNATDPTLPAIVANLLGQLVPGVSAMGKGSLAQQLTNSDVQPGMESFLNSQSPATGAPKAFLNWVLLDEKQYKMVSSGVASGTTPVPQITGTQEKQLLQANSGNIIDIPQNGYLYVFVSNESKGNVYFDDIRIDHIHGPLTDETHYYPFGLTMAGVSSQAFSFGQENKNRFNGIEQNTSFDLNIYDAFYRNLDPQIGRFWQVDPAAEGFQDCSVYGSMGNNPVNNVDPLGDFSTRAQAMWDRFWNGGGEIKQNEFGEWFVERTRTEAMEDGNAAIVSYRYYGEGRNRYTAAGEDILDAQQQREDIDHMVKLGVYERVNTQQEANDGNLKAFAGALMPNVLKISTAVSPVERALPNSGPIMKSLGAASKAERLAIKLKMNLQSETTRQVLNSLEETVESFISKYRKASIRSVLPGEFLPMTVEDALKTENSTVKKLLTNTDYVK
jgi:RHS repeat-associated protein